MSETSLSRIDALLDGASYPAGFAAGALIKEDNVAGVAAELRDLYQRTSPHANQHAFGPTQWAWEIPAYQAFANDMHSDDVAQDSRRRWTSLDPAQKGRAMSDMIHKLLKHLGRATASEAAGDRERAMAAVMAVMAGTLNDYHLTPDVSAAHLLHTPRDEDTAARNMVGVPYDADGPLQSFESTLETAVFLAARIHQTRLAAMEPALKPGHSLFLASRLFKLAEELSPLESDYGLAVYGPGQFEQWQNNPQYRHGDYAVNQVMEAYHFGEPHTPSRAFLFGRDLSFYVQCLRGVFFNPDDAYTAEQRLDTVERIIAMMPEHCLKGLNSVRPSVNLQDELKGLKEQLPAQASRIEMLAEKIMFYVPADKRVYLTITGSEETIKLIEKFQAEGAFRMIDYPTQSLAMDKLFDAAAKAEFNEAARLGEVALKIQTSAEHYTLIEEFEDAHILQLEAALRKNPVIVRNRERWAALSLDERVAHLMIVAQTQAAVFECQPMEEIVTFSMSRDEHAALHAAKKNVGQQYPAGLSFSRNRISIGGGHDYPGIPADPNSLVALNIHPDAMGALSNWQYAEQVVVHEQGHQHEDQIFSKSHSGAGLPEDHPYYAYAKGMVSLTRWKGDDLLGDLFYYGSMNERRCHALDHKYRAALNNRPLPRERTVLDEHIAMARTRIYLSGRRGAKLILGL